jgi:hypothetical protein
LALPSAPSPDTWSHKNRRLGPRSHKNGRYLGPRSHKNRRAGRCLTLEAIRLAPLTKKCKVVVRFDQGRLLQLVVQVPAEAATAGA